MTYELHPLCTLFPRITGAEFDSLVTDIGRHGLRDPIVLHDGMVLDGGNRYRACMEAGVEPRFVNFGGDDVVSFVLSANLHRRHLQAGQQAAIVALATDWGKAQRVGNPQFGNVAGLQSVSDRAAKSGASDRTQRMADKVARESPELAERVAHGEVSLPKAVDQIAPKPAKKEQGATLPDSEADELRGRIEELSANLAETLADNESMAKAFEADDRLAAALAESKQLRAEVASLRLRVNGLMNEKNEAVRSAKAWQRKYEKLAKGGDRA